MSWERDTYKAKCAMCGHEGTCIVSSDDWGRSETEWGGFRNEAPDATAVGRKRASAGDMRPICPTCGGSNIIRGERI